MRNSAIKLCTSCLFLLLSFTSWAQPAKEVLYVSMTVSELDRSVAFFEEVPRRAVQRSILTTGQLLFISSGARASSRKIGGGISSLNLG
ncbi:MAG: hypothetical protein MJA30_20475 [Cytophagales bacterium]|nr:hypothetical protein [Cytophagales bacterium]